MNSVRKGKSWEKEFVEIMRSHGWNFKRVPGSGLFGTTMKIPMLLADVVGEIPGLGRKLRFECKFGYGSTGAMKFNVGWIKKVATEARQTLSIPMVACKISMSRGLKGKFVVTIGVDYILDVLNQHGNTPNILKIGKTFRGDKTITIHRSDIDAIENEDTIIMYHVFIEELEFDILALSSLIRLFKEVENTL